MKYVCYAEQMRDVDRMASEVGAIPGIVLMENAAIACVEELKRSFCLNGCRVAVVCGKGNNAGDGFAVARHLSLIGAQAHVFLVHGREFKGDCAVNFEIIERMQLSIEEADLLQLEQELPGYDIVIDAIYGTGIHGEITGIGAEVISCINKYAKYILSVDIPSGIHADTGQVCGVCVHADLTVTFAAYKVGLLLFPGSELAGQVVVADISIPEYILKKQDLRIGVTGRGFVQEYFPKRKKNSQKGDYGKVFIIAGSAGLTGAAYMASQAALVSGSGLVTLGICESLNPILEQKLTEVMTLPLMDREGHLSKLCAHQITEQMQHCDAVLFGPGLGRDDAIYDLLRIVLEKSQVPVVIDADGLYALSKNIDLLNHCNSNLVLTPHAGEMARLLGRTVKEVEEQRLELSRAFAEEYGVTLILKGHHTVVTAADQMQYINITGNSGMATGGSGDVLAGMIISLLARGVEEAKAAAIAVYLHGAAGDYCACRAGENSVTPTGMLDTLPVVISQILQLETGQELCYNTERKYN